ncbi:XP_036361594.1uncharacterized protein LOC115215773 [Octopus vulgaris]|uniref:XP_036361594.1uncharacterized protein LOC115215773 n=1 Tax=Octopus vulgaris TaxID=6645 RepID=A0AA36F8R3_OCTVU|nr:XP_036361594.1uncharacterized protein LOC115215773 [Octopus vulgaris]
MSKTAMEETYEATSNVKYLNLSRSNMAFMKSLENYQQLEVLDLSQNHIEDISNIAFYQNLWKVDLSFNKITCLDGLTPFIALGCLNLSHNQVSWSELLKIRHIQILDLMLFGNPNLEKEKLYRIHLIDSLPNVWMLDGKLVTASEHLEVEQLFKMAKEQGLALVMIAWNNHLTPQQLTITMCKQWHKLPKNKFFPSYLRHLQINGAFGKKEETEIFGIQYAGKSPVGTEPVSLEFHLPTQVIVDMLALTSLHKYGNHLSIDLFLLPRTIRCLVVILLLNAIKVDNEEDSEEGIYDDLFLYVYNNVPDLLKLIDHRCDSLRKVSSNSSYKDYRSLLSAEICQILLLVPSFYQHIKLKDPGLISLLREATNEKDVCSIINDVFNDNSEQQAMKEVEEGGEEEDEDRLNSKQNSLRLVLSSLIQKQLKVVTSKQLVLTPCEHLLNSIKTQIFEDNGISRQKQKQQRQESQAFAKSDVVEYANFMICLEYLSTWDHLKYQKEHYENAAQSRPEYSESLVFEKVERRCLRSPFRSFSARTNKSKLCFYKSNKELVKQSSSEGNEKSPFSHIRDMATFLYINKQVL